MFGDGMYSFRFKVYVKFIPYREKKPKRRKACNQMLVYYNVLYEWLE